MDTSYYHNFITLVQTGNMTQAAEILHITQPALSKQLKYLEAEFGAQLINIKRGQRGSNLQLTDAGKIFYEKAQQLCSIEESTYNAVQQLNSRIEGTLAYCNLCFSFNPDCTAIFTSLFYEISVCSLLRFTKVS